MPDFHRDDFQKKTPTGGERWFLTVVAALFLGLLGASLLDDFENRKLAGFFVPFFWIPLLALHEAGHAVVARLCGWQVDRIVIGFGRTVRRFEIGGVPVLLKTYPISGYVLPRPLDLRAPRLKNTLIYAGGPGIEALLLGIITVSFGPETLLTLSDHIGIIAIQSLGVTILMGLAFTLIPHHTRSGGGKSWSDGMGILMSWRLPDEYFSSFINQPPAPEDEAE
jgi:hypothetical protein